MIVTLEFISGVSFGIQRITKRDLGDDEDGWYILLELGIIRLIFER
jgi:hypothetical protein